MRHDSMDKTEDSLHLEKGGVDVNYVEEDAHAAAERGHTATDQYGKPLVQFDPAAERRLARKIDLHIVPIVFVLYLFCFIDRANIGNARLAGFEKDLGLKGYQYNVLLTCFYIRCVRASRGCADLSYILFEIPSNIACKYFGPGKWIPFITFGFGLFSMLTAFVKNFSQGAAVRFLLGIFEAGMLPGIAYYLSR